MKQDFVFESYSYKVIAQIAVFIAHTADLSLISEIYRSYRPLYRSNPSHWQVYLLNQSTPFIDSFPFKRQQDLRYATWGLADRTLL